jgi:hypothetical protein
VSLETNLSRAFAAFESCIAAGLQPILTSEVQDGGNWREGEFDIALPMSYHGLLHEQIAEAVRIAESHGGRLWLGEPDNRLSILFPYERALGPGEPEDESPAQTRRRESRGGKLVGADKAKRKAS